MDKIVKTNETLESMASYAGGEVELSGQSDFSGDPVDTSTMQDKTLRFDKNSLAWISDDSSFFTCVRFSSGESIDDKNVIEDRRFL